jgi:putative membrane protein
MLLLANIAHLIVIFLHLLLAVWGMGFWKKLAPRLMGVSPEFAIQSAGLASYHGVHNIFLAFALMVGFAAPDEVGAPFAFYGLACTILAGIWGGFIFNRRIFFIQAVPAIVALLLRASLID